MKIINTKIKDLKIIQSPFFRDSRGKFREVYQKKIDKKKNFIFDCMSFSKKNVLRGLHFQSQKPQAKLITVVHGKILDVVVDLRKRSKTFGKHFSIMLTEKSNLSLLIPKKFAHGFLCLSKKCVIYYKCSNYRHKKSEKTISWNDPDLKINWPCTKPILSKKDKNGMSFKSLK